MGLVSVPPTVAGAVAPTTTIYNSSDPTAVGQNLASLGQEAYAFTKMGNEIQLAAGTSRTLNNVTVQMSSWGCGDSGTWYDHNCATTAGETFSLPLTLNLYVANPDNTPGLLLDTVTQTVTVPYRPASDIVNCTGANLGKWYNVAAASCFNGIVSNVTLNLGDVTVPDKLIYAVEYRTTSTGDPALGGPIGTLSCNATSQKCPYDSLNVALSSDPTNVTTGSNVQTNGIYWDTTAAGNYCDNGVGGTGTLRFDGGCWGENAPYTSAPYYVPAVQFNAEATCTTACYVSPTGNDTSSGQSDSPFATIQHAVDTVSSGGIVNVAAGTYNENVVISHSLSLLGANAGVRATGAPRATESVISTSNAGNDYTVDVNAPNVTVDGFTLQQTAAVTCSSCAAFGVQVEQVASGAVVTDNIISGMATTGSSGSPAGNPIGVDVSADGSTSPNGVTVSQNMIKNISSTGTQHRSALGIEIGDSSLHPVGTGLSITGNHVTNVTGASWGSYGMIINRPTTGTSISGNTFDTIQGGAWARGIGLEANETSASVLNNSISGITSTNPNPGAASDLFFESGTTSPGTTVTDNSFGGTNAGVVNLSSGVEDVTTNWWGCAGGPNAAGCSGAGGTGSLTLTPWIVSFTPDGAKAGQPGFWPTLITVPTNTATITSSPLVQIGQGKLLNFTVTTGGHPAATLSAVGLPAWVTLTNGSLSKAGTAKLSGIAPTVGGTYTFAINANNGNGYPVTSQTFTIYALGFSSPAAVNFSKTGGVQSFTVHTSGVSAGVNLSATLGIYETGLTFTDNGNGTATISGTPVAPAKTHLVTVTAVSGGATAKQRLAIGITP